MLQGLRICATSFSKLVSREVGERKKCYTLENSRGDTRESDKERSEGKTKWIWRKKMGGLGKFEKAGMREGVMLRRVGIKRPDVVPSTSHSHFPYHFHFFTPPHKFSKSQFLFLTIFTCPVPTSMSLEFSNFIAICTPPPILHNISLSFSLHKIFSSHPFFFLQLLSLSLTCPHS